MKNSSNDSITSEESKAWNKVFKLGVYFLKVPMPNAGQAQDLIQRFKAKGETCQDVRIRIMEWSKSPYIIKETKYLNRLLGFKSVESDNEEFKSFAIAHHKNGKDIMTFYKIKALNKTREEILAWLGLNANPVELPKISLSEVDYTSEDVTDPGGSSGWRNGYRWCAPSFTRDEINAMGSEIPDLYHDGPNC